MSTTTKFATVTFQVPADDNGRALPQKVWVAKLGKFQDVPVWSWGTDAIINAMLVGNGRTIGDAHAGESRKDYDTGIEGETKWRKNVQAAIDTRILNLSNADVRTGGSAKEKALEEENAALKAELEAFKHLKAELVKAKAAKAA